MNEVMQRMLPATVLTLALHGALLCWRMQQPQTLRPAPLPRKISVSLKRLPPPPPPLQKIVQEAPALPKIIATEHPSIRPLLPKSKPKPRPKAKPLQKIVQKTPALTLPKITRVQRQPVRPILLKPGKKFSAVPLPLPKLAPVIRQPIKLLTVQPAKKSESNIIQTQAPVQSSVASQPIRQAQPITSRQQPVVRRMTTSRRTYQQPIRRNTHPIRRTPPITRQMTSSIPVKTTTRTTTQTTQPVGTGVVREAAPLYKSNPPNPPPEYPRMARRRGLEGIVTLEAHIGINGRVEELRLFASSGHTILDKAALKAVRAWRFSPGTIGGKAQSMWVQVPVRFTLR